MRKQRLRNLTVFATVAAAIVLAASPGMGAALNPGQFQFNPALSANAFTTSVPTSVSSGTLVTSLPTAFSGPNFSGTLTSSVYSYQGQLTFTYRLTGLSGTSAAHYIDILQLRSNWSGVVITDAGAFPPGQSHPVGSPSWSNGAPAEIHREFLDAYVQAGFFYPPSNAGTILQSGDSSQTIFLVTTSTGYAQVGDLSHNGLGATILNSETICEGAPILVPVAPSPSPPAVPEPASLALLGIAGLPLGWVALRRRLKK